MRGISLALCCAFFVLPACGGDKVQEGSGTENGSGTDGTDGGSATDGATTTTSAGSTRRHVCLSVCATASTETQYRTEAIKQTARSGELLRNVTGSAGPGTKHACCVERSNPLTLSVPSTTRQTA